MSRRLIRLQDLLSRLKNGVDIQSRDLRSVLTETEWNEFNSWWTEEKQNRNLTPPKELIKYLNDKKLVDLAFARYEKYEGRPVTKRNSYISNKMEQDAQNIAERVLEYIREQLSVNPSLMLWLIAVEPFGSVEDSLSANVLPMVCTSRTVTSEKRAPMGKQSKRELKIMIIEQAIASFEGNESEEISIYPQVKKVSVKKDFSDFKF
jgi:hypothetical protein